MKKLIRKIPFISGLFHTVPPYHTGNVAENKAGLQVIRVLGINFLQNLKAKKRVSKSNEPNLDVLENDGIVEFKNFLSDEDWQKVRGEYDAYKDKLEFVAYKPSEKYSMRAARVDINKNPQHFPETIRIMGHNDKLNELAAAVLRKDIKKLKPGLSYLILKKDENAELDDDIENILHADVHYHTIKAFLYLSPASEDNGAYIYAKGSHKLSLSRLKFEYNMSVRVAKLRRGDNDIAPKYLDQRGNILRNIVSEEQRKHMHINEKQYIGEANTLVMSDNLGFHRRGEFKPSQVRETLLVNYRGAEAGWLRKYLNR